MKNIFVLFLSIFAITLFSTQSFAAAQTSTAGTSKANPYITLGSTTGTTGKTVTINLSVNDTAAYLSTAGKTYAAITYNPNGAGQEYGTASDTSNIMQKSYTGTVVPATALTTGNATDVTSGTWTPVGS